MRQTGWSEGTWDCSFSDSNEVLQSDEAESPKGVSQAVFDERPKAREKIKKKLEAARHVEVTAEDKTGETFTGWTVEGVEIADKGSKKLNFKMPANDVTLTANYSTNSYTLTVKNGSPESVTDEVGTEVTLTANEPDEGMTFDRWELSDDTILVSGELTDAGKSSMI